ncbi:MAG: hypothetical protein KC933_12880, partial [Myxococcales bacterium]|nr:hypothetical protein [Myxococcales bacterium]
ALRLGLTPTLTWSPGGLGPGATLALSGTWMFGERWGAGVFGTVPVLRGAVERPAGRATLAVTVVGAAVRYQPWGRGQRWTPSLDLGVAAALLRSRGEVTSALLQGEDVSAWTAAAQLQLGQAFTLGDLVRLRADATVGLLLAPALLRFAGEEVATWGRPFFSVGVGADLGWTLRM